MQSHNLQYAPARCALHFFHFVKERTSILDSNAADQEVRQSDDPRTNRPRIDLSYLSSRNVVELVGIEPTTYGLQSRRSPS